MKKLLVVLLHLIAIGLLTILTQVGGVVYVVSLMLFRFTDRLAKTLLQRRLYRSLLFLVCYGLATFVLVPKLAVRMGRVPLPVFTTNHVQPLTVMTCLLNRHYVRRELRQVAYDVAMKMNERFPGTKVNYLDANFPFFNGYPLFPHLSHSDGKKLDLAFLYLDKQTAEYRDDAPSIIGYGIGDEPLPGERNTAGECAEKGYWLYSLMRNLMPQGSKNNFVTDAKRTRVMINLFAGHPSIGKLFLEPHLKTRWGLSSGKIRFHGCRAVRHDDHVHVQLR